MPNVHDDKKQLMNTSIDTKALSDFFKQLTHFEQSEPNATFLSIGGRGYYENPASDLLQFFLQPDNAHNLGSLFLEAFLETAFCHKSVKVSGKVQVLREQRTNEGNRIDLMVSTPEWILMIENKIWHDQINPFSNYEELSQSLANGRAQYFAILSPEGRSEQINWKGVSYQNFIDAINSRLSKCSPEIKTSKWFHFAQDFTLHLSQELYEQDMTLKEIQFAEDHQKQLADAEKLQERYRQHLRKRLPTLVSRPGAEATQENWCIRLRHPEWSKADLAWAHQIKEGYLMKLSVYFYELTETELAEAKVIFGEKHRLLHSWESNGRTQFWRTEDPFQTRKEAESKLQEFANELFLLKEKWETRN
ncbi:PD-(D/E)XK nuclease family protein [Roseibacillus persicicus]|uniref:PD-(D/E)XK nuclease family protein n=1 Tax=Roseibacillus persicicus TaxID=454148 RepID=UPI00280CF971|nr:PD-(D/E)XK nuclease family protein [Roseibacillus persicicus]MDQ8192444.1 PD-(D/E)XK nuclease family protein [Roseibacillus persicicus]